MMKLTKAALVAAAFLSSAQANAASILYSFGTTGTGTRTGAIGDPDPYATEILRDLVFTYSIADGYPMTRQDNGDLTFILAPGGGSATSSGLAFSLNSANRESGSISACFSNPTASFPGVGQTIAATCGGSVAFEAFNLRYGATSYSGTVTSVTALPNAGGTLTGLASITSLVPEPTTWALMLAGFGMVGYAMRRRRAGFTVLA